MEDRLRRIPLAALFLGVTVVIGISLPILYVTTWDPFLKNLNLGLAILFVTALTGLIIGGFQESRQRRFLVVAGIATWIAVVGGLRVEPNASPFASTFDTILIGGVVLPIVAFVAVGGLMLVMASVSHKVLQFRRNRLMKVHG